MEEQGKIDYYQLNVGHELKPQSYTLDESVISSYLKATQEANDLFLKDNMVPPMAVVAFAMTAQSQGVNFPWGTVHVSQELEFSKLVRVGDTITCYSKVSRKNYRGGLFIMATDITVLDQKQEKILTGKVGFVLPDPAKGQSV